MGVQLKHDGETGITHLVGYDTLCDADLAQFMRDGEHGALILSGGGVLLDLRNVEHLAVTARGLADAARHPNGKSSTVRAIKLAIVGESDEAFGIGRVFQGHRNADETLQVFRDHDAAVAWLLDR